MKLSFMYEQGFLGVNKDLDNGRNVCASLEGYHTVCVTTGFQTMKGGRESKERGGEWKAVSPPTAGRRGASSDMFLRCTV